MAAAGSTVSAQTILDLADAARNEAPIERALRVAAAGGADAARLRDAPLGRLHAAALEFHRALVGPLLDGVAPCPSCDALVEFSFDVGAFAALDDIAAAGELIVPTAAGSWHVSWSAPTAADLTAALADADAGAEAAATLFARCCRLMPPEGREGAAPPPEVIERVEAAFAEADPLAELTVALACPDCGTGFVADIDPLAFVWREVQTRAHRVLRDVDALARAYGWTEPEVLALPDDRRATYLEIIREGA